MIKIKGLSRQLDDVIVTIEFDDYEGNLHEVTYTVKAAVLKDMTLDEIKQKVKDKIAIERMNLIEEKLRQKLEGIIGIDLEAS